MIQSVCKTSSRFLRSFGQPVAPQGGAAAPLTLGSAVRPRWGHCVGVVVESQQQRLNSQSVYKGSSRWMYLVVG